MRHCNSYLISRIGPHCFLRIFRPRCHPSRIAPCSLLHGLAFFHHQRCNGRCRLSHNIEQCASRCNSLRSSTLHWSVSMCVFISLKFLHCKGSSRNFLCMCFGFLGKIYIIANLSIILNLCNCFNVFKIRVFSHPSMESNLFNC
jgi:hypothetical protein